MGDWWRDAVVYQIYPRSFQDSDGDGIGDLDGITERLGYLAEDLGVDVVWLSPFYPSPMADFGYDVSEFCDVDPVFGDLGSFDRLLARAHRLGLKVLIDLVPNHTSAEHPWFQASRSSRQDPKRDWYVWRDSRPDGSPPNNWLSVFGGPAWEWDEPSGQWYLHSFLAEQPDLDWRNPDVREAMWDVVRFWLDRGVDGFRIDVAHFVMKDPALRDNPLRSGEAITIHKPMGYYDSQEHLYDKGHPDVLGVYKEMRAVLDEYRPSRFSVGEIHEMDPDVWAGYYGDGDGLDMPFNFALLKAGWDARRLREVIAATERVVPGWGWPNYVLGNHDETRLASRIGPEAARAAAVLLLTLRGTPTLYYGDELGMEEAAISPEEQQDPWGRRVPGLGRDGCRTPMQWTEGREAGFTEGDPWLPVGSVAPVDVQAADPGSMLNLYRRLLALRKASAALVSGGMRLLEGPPSCVVYERGGEFLVAINCSREEVRVEVGVGTVSISSDPGREESALTGELILASLEAVVVRRG